MSAATMRRSCAALLTGALLAATAGASTAGASPEAAPFQITDFTMLTLENASVVADSPHVLHLENVPSTFTRAGGHPWGLATLLRFTTLAHQAAPTGDPKDIVVDLPPGLLGNPTAVSRCPLGLALSHVTRCPTDTQVGIFRLKDFGGSESLAPIVNLTPERGQSAEFGLETDSNLTFLLTGHVVRDGAGYTLAVTSNDIPMVEISEVETTFWGVPADPSHDAMRGLVCEGIKGLSQCEGGGVKSGVAPVPFLTMPTDCAQGPEKTTVRVDTWEQPGEVTEGHYTGYREASAVTPGMNECELLRFDPEVEAQPNTPLADEPVELGVNLRVPQVLKPAAAETPQLRNAVVTLPEGLSISPGIVDGIEACNESGPEGINFEGRESEERGANGELQLAAGHCPDASQVGEAEAETPLLAEPVKGHVYLARPGCGGAGQSACTERDAADGNLYQLYLELGGVGPLADTGVNLKVRLKTEANPATGQLTTVAEDNPQLPFSELRIRLNGGPRSPLDNPAACGDAVTTADLTPWSAPGITPVLEGSGGLQVPGTADATPSSLYEVTGCSSPPPLRPGFSSGTVTPQAGAYSSFTMDLSRRDREQFVKGIQVHTPPGLLGMLASVPLCEEPLADSGHCPQASQIGTTRVASGAGSHPFEIEGDVYLTSGYRGAPFGLSIVTDAVAGPFDLGLVVVRARIAVDPETAALTVTTDETGPYAIPQIIFGVPLRLQRVTVDIDRPNFMLNPTNCGAPGAPGSQQVSATISGSQNATADVASRFAVGGCKFLQFKPTFTAATGSHTSRANGAGLDTKLTYPKNALGNDANIASVHVELPKALPSRLSTLQKACLAATFEGNPAACPPASVVGVARAKTPLLPVEVSGPVYFVSHGGEAFPSLIIVLQGDGVRVDLTGATFINKAGVTSTTFKTIPDVPVSSFELYLPQGEYSALTANENLCSAARSKTRIVKRQVVSRIRGRKVHRTIRKRIGSGGLVMPTEFVAQNGAVFRQNTPIVVQGCAASRSHKPKESKRQPKRSLKGRTSR